MLLAAGGGWYYYDQVLPAQAAPPAETIETAQVYRGDLVIAAELVTPEAVNFMAKEGRGLICLSLTEERADELDLPLMVQENSSSFGTAFTVSIEARRGVSRGPASVAR